MRAQVGAHGGRVDAVKLAESHDALAASLGAERAVRVARRVLVEQDDRARRVAGAKRLIGFPDEPSLF